MIELVYISHARENLSQQNLVDLLTQARANNEKLGITGMLLYDGYDVFIQVIEGPKKDVESIFEKINKDTRHHRLSILWSNKIEQRNFPEWQMGFKDIRDLNTDELQGYSDFMQNPDVNTHSDHNVSFARELLRRFKQNYQA